MNPNSNPKKSSKKSASSSKPVTTTATAPAPAPVVTSPSPAASRSPTPVAPIGAGVIAQCNLLLGQVSTLLGPGPVLSPSEIKRSLKLRKGGAQVVADLVALCAHHGITSVGPVTVAAMSAEIDRANALNQIGVKLSAVQKGLTDAAFSSESTCWQYATALYTVLVRLALMDPTLAAGLQPVQAFFQTKKTKGTRHALAASQKVKAGEAAAAKYPHAATSKTPAPAAVVGGTGTSAGAAPSGTNGAGGAVATVATSGAAPVATLAAPTNGAAHS